MKNPETDFDYPFAEGLSLPERLWNATHEHRSWVKTVAFEAHNILMGGVEKLRQSPVGSIEVGTALAITGAAAGAATVSALRHR